MIRSLTHRAALTALSWVGRYLGTLETRLPILAFLCASGEGVFSR